MVLWGLATACTAGAHDYHSLLVARIFLGIFEAAVAPSLILISSQWYTKSEQAPRFSLWYCGLGCGQIVGGTVSYAFQQVKLEPMAGWRIMFIVLGLVTIMVGMGAFYIIPDTPVEATFLSDNEKLALLHHVSVNRTGIQNTNYKPSQLIELLLDPQIYLLTILTVLVSRDLSAYSQIRSIKLTDNLSLTDINLIRRNNNLFCDPDPKLWLQPSSCRPVKLPLWPGLHRFLPDCGLRDPTHLLSLGMDRSSLHTRSNRGIPYVLSPYPPRRRTLGGDLSCQRHHCHPRCNISMDLIERGGTHQTYCKCSAHCRKLQRGKHHRSPNLSSKGCTAVYPRENHCTGYSSHCSLGRCPTLLVLCVGK